jgi:hypothetical protein
MRGDRTRRVATVSAVVMTACLLAGSTCINVASAQAPAVYGWWAQASVGAVDAPAPPDVPPDGMYIQDLPSGPSAISALSFETPPGTSSGKLTLQITGTPVITQPPVACLVTSTFKATEGGSWSDKPSYDCTHSVPGVADSGQTELTFTVDKLIVADGALDVVVLATGPTDRVAFAKPDAQSLQTAPPPVTTPPSQSRGAGESSAGGGQPSQPTTAPAPVALPPPAPAVATPGAPAPVVAATPSRAPQAAGTTAVSRPASNSLRRRLGEMLGVALVLACLLYWTDGFGAVPLRSTLIRRPGPRSRPARSGSP